MPSARPARTPPRPVRAFVSDLDGTLLRSDGTLPRSTTAAMSDLRDRGLAVVVATSRTPRAIRRIDDHGTLGTVVCAGGAILWDAGRDEVVHQTGFGPASLAAAVRRMDAALPGTGIALLSADVMHLNDRYLALRPRKGLSGAQLLPDVALAAAGDRTIAIVALRHPDAPVQQVVAAAAESFAGVGQATFAGGSTVEVSPLGVTKAQAVEAVLAPMGCHARSTVVFGDMPNDLPLFALGGWSCAMANSHPDVLAAADEVVGSNDGRRGSHHPAPSRAVDSAARFDV